MSESSPQPAVKPLLSDGLYNKLKHTAVLLLPAFGTLYLTLAPIWHFPKAEEVVASTAALNVFIGVLISISSRAHSKTTPTYVGDLVPEPDPEGGPKKILVAHLKDDPSAISQMDQVIFRVRQE